MFLKAWFSNSNAASSKRIAGSLGFVIAIILIVTGNQHPAITDLLYCSVGLLGLGTVDRIAQSRSGGQNSYYPYNYTQNNPAE